jgi:putative endonuclease
MVEKEPTLAETKGKLLRMNALESKQLARKKILEYMQNKQLKPQKWSYVYILRCADDTLYTDLTNSISYSLYSHNAGKEAKYTKSRLPVKLVYWEVFNSKQEAMKRRDQLKRFTRAKKLRLIEKTGSL